MKPLWSPSPARKKESMLAQFAVLCERRTGQSFETYEELHQFSVSNKEDFWKAVLDFAELEIDLKGAVVAGQGMPGTVFFPESRLNYAENLLVKKDNTPALMFWGEDKCKKSLTWAEVHNQVSSLQQALKSFGVKEGTVVAGIVPNLPETVVAMLAVTSLGGVWSSCSPDFGVEGILDRFEQIKPDVLFACDGYYYNGKSLSITEKVAAVHKALPSVRETILIPYINAPLEEDALTTQDLFQKFPAQDVTFSRIPFNSPLFILFSSGTTGKPKCIVHGVGGTLLQHRKEHLLQSNILEGDKVFYFTTCGWMMWNWLVSALGVGATLLLYDGSPFYPNGNILFDYMDAENGTFFGTSAKFIESVAKAGLSPIKTHKLSHLRSVASTGSPLSEEGFRFVYSDIKHDVHLASISGGTDIVSCFVLGNPWQSVYAGQIQGAGLGMDIDVFDEDGNSLSEGKGELVCKSPFPSMPIYFWNDEGGKKYHAAYFERFPNIWAHGDFAEKTKEGGMIIHGRSDATLNPGGVRIGTAEIYAQVEKIPDVLESLAIGQTWENDVRVVLFVRLREGVTLTDDLKKQIQTVIRVGASPRHVPAKIIAVSDIPRTKSGKITEIAVRDMVEGRGVKNKEALANPEALSLFENIEELKA